MISCGLLKTQHNLICLTPPQSTSKSIAKTRVAIIGKKNDHMPQLPFLNQQLNYLTWRFAIKTPSVFRFVIVFYGVSFEDRYLLQRKTDNDIITLTALVKAVRRDAYKMSAYLRFRKIDSPDNETERFVAWYEPEHYSLELKLDFFKTRFKNMQWSILTPYRAAHWDMTSMVLQDTPSRAQYPKEDEVEKYWLTYYANIFNPARPKKKAMLSSMPKKYWKNMPETVLIEDLIRTAESKSRKMIDNAASD